MEEGPLPLREQCFLHLVCHVMEYSPQEVALLPVHHRRALLRTIAPVHLYCLEQSAIANGIDTDAIWKEIKYPGTIAPYWTPNWRSPNDSYKDDLGAQHISYVWHAFLGTERQYHDADLYYDTLIKSVFAIHAHILEHSTTKFLKSHPQPWFVSFPAYPHHYLVPIHCAMKSVSEAASYLIKTGALPSVLDLKVRCFQDCRLYHQRNSGVLKQLLQKSKVKRITVDFSGGETNIGEFILQNIVQSADSVLDSLELPNLRVAVLRALVPLFSAPEGYSGLKVLQAELCSEVQVATTAVTCKYSLFASIVAHQTALESLDLSQLGDFPDDTQGQRFILALTSLLRQPQFRRLKLCWCKGLPLAALQSITEAFMSSSPQSEQHLTLVSMKVVVLPIWQSLLHSKRYRSKAHLSVSAEHAAAVGLRKHLCFQYSHIPCAFLEWFCNMKYIHLNTLEFLRCTSDSSKCTIREHFEGHPNFSAQYFRCS